MSQIHEAILDFNLEKVRDILSSTPAAANERNASGLTPLMLLSSTTLHDLSYYEKLSKLQVLGLVAQDAAEQVIRNKSLLVIENMAKAIAATPGVELNAVTTEELGSKTALHMAAASNNEDLVNLLIEAKVDLNIQDADGHTALMDAASFAVRRALVYAGCDLAVQDKHGNNVLHYILSSKIPDTPSSRLITSMMAEDLLQVKNKAGRTPQELAEETAKEVAARFEADAKADMLRAKREWEEAFTTDAKVSDLSPDSYMYNAASYDYEKNSSNTHGPETCSKLQPQKKVSWWWKVFKYFSCFSCCCCRAVAPAPEPKIVYTEKALAKKSLILNANQLIYGQASKPADRLERPKDVLLRSDPIKGEFVAPAGPCLGSDEDICADEKYKEYYTTNVRDEWPPRPVEPPLHRQTNFSSEQEQEKQAEAQPEAEPQPSQLEKEMDEVFSILRTPATQPTE